MVAIPRGCVVLAFGLAGCAGRESGAGAAVPKPALDAITAEGILQHTRTLSGDEYEGRAPATPGEEKTVAYLTQQFQQLGLQPGNPDGSWVQNVALVGFTTTPRAALRVKGKPIALQHLTDYVAVSRRYGSEVSVDNSELVFVGYGVVAPEYGWDDYKGLDVKGKTLVMLINDPAVLSGADSTQFDSTMFKGKAMTYYGRWTYKYEIASEKGAAAAIIVHETGPAGYPFEVVSGSWGRENFDIKRSDNNAGRVAVESWITRDKARELFAAAGQDFEALKRAAARRDFQPVSLSGTATFHIQNTVREVQSKNVIARLEGADPAFRDQYVIYTAHWDHLGRDSTIQDDQIFNGALDNASGTAALLMLAKAFTALPSPPPRSVLFLAVTAEEKGLLGAKYYAENPLYPLDRTLADINIDGVNQWGRTSDITIVGYGNSTLDDELAAVLQTSGRTIRPDPEPEKGFFYRSDHFEFAKQGVPSLYIDSGVEYIGRDSTYGQRKRDEYTEKYYHKPSDEVMPDWDLSGAVEDTQALLAVGYRVARTERWPEWKPGTEFRAKREAMLEVGR